MVSTHGSKITSRISVQYPTYQKQTKRCHWFLTHLYEVSVRYSLSRCALLFVERPFEKKSLTSKIISLCRKDGTKVVTRIKNISGDIEKFVRELRIVLSIPQPANQLQSYDAIRLRAGNLIEIQGHRAGEIRSWLGQLGF